MLKPGGREIKAHEMPLIIDFVGQRPPADVWDDYSPSGATEDQPGGRAVTPARLRVRIVAVHSPGTLRAKDAEPQALGHVDLMEENDPRLDGLEKYGVWIEQPRKYAICVDYFSVRVKPLAGDEVFVRRTNAAGLVEDTIRFVEVSRGKVRLVLYGKNFKGVDKSVDYPSANPAETVEIKGLVIGEYEKKF